MARAIVTMAAGERCYKPWRRHLYPGWQQWCERHGFTLVVFEALLDTSDLGRSRSPTWQKLLAMASVELRPFEQVLWLDADVMVCPWAADPLALHDPRQVAMARDDGSPLADQPEWFRRGWAHVLTQSLGAKGIAVPAVSEPFSYLDLWGFDARRRPLFNNGVVAFSPQHHSDLWLHLYHDWPDGGPGALDEMVPMNLELQQRGLLQELDGRFNRLIGVYHALWRIQTARTTEWLGLQAHAGLNEFAQTLAQSCHLLHFAGAHGLMEHLCASGVLA
jgi:hypothetical protein